MKISYSWLKDYLQFDLPAEKVGELLTDSGLEVEGIETFETVPGGLEGLVIGEVVSCQKHPDADRLNLTHVDIGKDDLLNIVCGAPNVSQGQKVVVAPVGCTLYPTQGKPFKIKRSKIRGQVSEGMICAEDEIGIGKSHDGIMVLDSSAVVGTPAAQYFNLKSDSVFEIGLTPNRADAMSHYGVARDLVAVFNRFGIKHSPLSLPQIDQFPEIKSPPPITFEVKDTDACPRYVGVCIEDVVVKPSPDWLQTKLKSIGLNPINNVVDITNFVLHELGQPLHAFDADKIEGKKVIVKSLPPDSSFVTLDEVDRKLSDQDLMICNTHEGMCIAGVFGGFKSGVTSKTKNIFLESAYFNPVSIRKTAKRHGLNTDASFRFERGIDPNITVYAAKRAALLIQEFAEGKIVSDAIDFYPNPIKGFDVELKYTTCDRLIGKSIERELIKSILTDLGIEIKKESETGLSLYVPPFKVDVQREADVIEEILRIYGYNAVENPQKMNISLVNIPKPDPEKLKNIAFDYLASNGFHEMMANSLTRSEYYDSLDQAVEILNPLSQDLNVMRQSMLFSGLEAIAYNQNRHEPNLRLFEFGKTYHQYSTGNAENQVISVYLTGNTYSLNWLNPEVESGIFTLKGVVESLLQRMGLNPAQTTTKEINNSEFEFGISFYTQKMKLADLGQVHTNLQSQFDIKNPVYYAHINWDNLLEIAKRSKTKFEDIPRFPSVRRDLALLVDQNVSFQQLKQIARLTERKLLKNVGIFDVYTGKGLEPGKKSYALSFEFRDDNKTLTDNIVDKSIKKIYEQMVKQAGVKLRSGNL